MPAPPHHPPWPAAETASRRPRPWAALGVAGVVLWLHGLLIGGLAPKPAGRPGVAKPTVTLQVRTLPWPVAAPRQAVADVPPAALVLAPAAAPAPDRSAKLGERAAADAAPGNAVPAGAAREPAHLAVAGGAAPQPAQLPLPSTADIAGTGTATATGTTTTGAADTTAEAPPAEPPTAEPPPVYPTRVPAPVLLHYALRYNGQAGEATLAWRHDGQAYSLQLDGRGAQRPLVEQTSRGGFDAAGLAPERFIDRRRGARWQAANFRRDIGRIAFSGPAIDYPAWPGAQDRLSWLAQLVAIRAAAVAAAPGAAAPAAPEAEADISLFVVDARGAGGLWRFVHQGEVRLASPLGPQTAQLWQREPPRPEGLRVQAWLDARRGHWPLQLRFTALRSGDVFELVLQAEPALPP